MGRDPDTRDAHLVVPITWDAAAQHWKLGKVNRGVRNVTVKEDSMPLREGPGSGTVTDTSLKAFLDKYSLVNYAPTKGAAAEQTENGEDPVLEIDKINLVFGIFWNPLGKPKAIRKQFGNEQRNY